MDDYLFTVLLVPPYSFVVQCSDENRNMISCEGLRLFTSQKSFVIVNVIRPLCQMTNTCPCFICGMCKIFLVLVRLNSSFPFFWKNHSNPSVLFSLCLKLQRISNFKPFLLLVRFLFFMLSWWFILILILLDESAPLFPFFFARLGVYLDYYFGWHPQQVSLCLLLFLSNPFYSLFNL